MRHIGIIAAPRDENGEHRWLKLINCAVRLESYLNIDYLDFNARMCQ